MLHREQWNEIYIFSNRHRKSQTNWCMFFILKMMSPPVQVVIDKYNFPSCVTFSPGWNIHNDIFLSLTTINNHISFHYISKSHSNNNKYIRYAMLTSMMNYKLPNEIEHRACLIHQYQLYRKLTITWTF